jgi:hypothetical protein
MKPADVSSLRMLRRARDRIDRDYAEPIAIPALAAGPAPIPGCFALMWRSGLPAVRVGLEEKVQTGNASLPEKAPPRAGP